MNRRLFLSGLVATAAGIGGPEPGGVYEFINRMLINRGLVLYPTGQTNDVGLVPTGR